MGNQAPLKIWCLALHAPRGPEFKQNGIKKTEYSVAILFVTHGGGSGQFCSEITNILKVRAIEDEVNIGFFINSIKWTDGSTVSLLVGLAYSFFKRPCRVVEAALTAITFTRKSVLLFNSDMGWFKLESDDQGHHVYGV